MDLDGLTQEQQIQLSSKSFLQDIKNHFNLEDIVLTDSASRLSYKKKLFLKGSFTRSFVENNDIFYEMFLNEFEKYTSIKTDHNQTKLTQLTFGCKDNKLHDVSTIFHYSFPSKQPTKQVSDDFLNFNQTSAKADSTCSPSSQVESVVTNIITPSTPPKMCNSKNVTTHQPRIIPLNPSAYNKKFGKDKRQDARLDWDFYHFSKSGMKLNFIKEGHRQTSVGKIILTVCFHALNCNERYGTDYDSIDVAYTVKVIVKTQFEKGEQFFEESKTLIMNELKDKWNTAQELRV